MTSGLMSISIPPQARNIHSGRGDFYVIEPGVVCAQKSDPYTEISVHQATTGDDKVPVDITPEVQAWLEKPIQE
jgi:hypothetical protein